MHNNSNWKEKHDIFTNSQVPHLIILRIYVYLFFFKRAMLSAVIVIQWVRWWSWWAPHYIATQSSLIASRSWYSDEKDDTDHSIYHESEEVEWIYLIYYQWNWIEAARCIDFYSEESTNASIFTFHTELNQLNLVAPIVYWEHPWIVLLDCVKQL